MKFKFNIGNIVSCKLANGEQVNCVVVGRMWQEDADSHEVSYFLFNKKFECSQLFKEEDILHVPGRN